MMSILHDLIYQDPGKYGSIVCMYVCMYGCMHACMHMYMHICIVHNFMQDFHHQPPENDDMELTQKLQLEQWRLIHFDLGFAVDEGAAGTGYSAPAFKEM